MARYNFVVFTNPVEGRDTEFNNWYDNRHIVDVLAVPGFTAAQRFRAHHVRGEPPFKYMAIYEIDTDNVEGVFADVASRSRTDRMPVSDALAPGSQSFVYEAIGDPVRG